MSVYDPTRCLSVPGRLYLNPTSAGMLAGVPPYNGTELGVKSRAVLVREQSYAYSNSEANGRNKVAAYGGRYSASFTFVLTQYDPDVLQKVWAYSTTSPNGYQGAVILTIPKAGQTTLSPGLIATGSPLLFSADDPTNPSILILAPIWTLNPKLDLDEVLDKPLETSIVVVAGIDANGNDIRCDLLQNLATT